MNTHVTEIDYDKLVEKSLRNVVRESLSLTAKNGLPGDHHFYITFMTRHPGVTIDDALLENHPEQMTIVLQYQFENLTVTDTDFSVSLSFNGVSHFLQVPFAAINYFADPWAKFGLRFSVDEVTEATQGSASKSENASENISDSESRDDNSEEGKVVALDAFRKK